MNELSLYFEWALERSEWVISADIESRQLIARRSGGTQPVVVNFPDQAWAGFQSESSNLWPHETTDQQFQRLDVYLEAALHAGDGPGSTLELGRHGFSGGGSLEIGDLSFHDADVFQQNNEDS